jgi:TonB family protein
VQLFRNERAVLGTWGFLRPRIFLPHDADEWPDERIHVVLTHEFAHIKRFDWPVQMLAEIARAVYWFNPLFWAACRRLRSESEHACDDVVLNAGFDAKDYAAHLLDLARTLTRSERTWSSPVLAMSRPPNLERRFVAMLNPSVNRRVINRATLLATCAIAVSVTLSLASVRAPEQTLQPTASPAPAVRASALTPTPAVPITPSPVSMKPAAARPVRRQGLADGSLAGIVLDPTGAVVPGVIVIVRSDKIATETVTGPVGQYEFRALPPGVYTLTAQLPGFVTAGIGRLEIQSSQTLKQNVMLSVGTVAQRVAVSAVGQPKPAPLPGTPQRVRIGGNVRAANLISMVRPDYPPAARDSGIEGTVHLQGIIGIDGALAGLRVISITDPELAAAAIESVRQWRYRPALLNGTPVEVITEIDVDFRLTQ